MGCPNNCDKPDNCTQQPACDRLSHQVVATYADVQEFRNAFVTVRDENAVYHVDEHGNPVAVSRSPIFINNFIPTTGAYKQNTVYDFATNKSYVFNPAGAYKEIDLV